MSSLDSRPCNLSVAPCGIDRPHRGFTGCCQSPVSGIQFPSFPLSQTHRTELPSRPGRGDREVFTIASDCSKVGGDYCDLDAVGIYPQKRGHRFPMGFQSMQLVI